MVTKMKTANRLSQIESPIMEAALAYLELGLCCINADFYRFSGYLPFSRYQFGSCSSLNDLNEH
jgi:hypothetical protein